MSTEPEELIHCIVEQAYSTLNVDRISVFTYDGSSKNLFCLVSKDIKGACVPVETGLVGSSFSTTQVIHSADVAADERHNKMFDANFDFEPKSSLSAPIVSADGRTLGVVQALNKRDGTCFSAADESKLLEICSRSAVILQPGILNIYEPIYAQEQLFSWEFNMLDVESLTKVRCTVGNIFSMMFDFGALNISASALASYLLEVERLYRDNPFHNFRHAATVTHVLCLLSGPMGAREKLGDLLHFAVILSAVVHDVDHPGNTNAFEINSGSELAILYNDQSVLENHHCATAFRLMNSRGVKLLEAVGPAEQKEFRRVMVSSILATDMSMHFQLVEEVNTRMSTGWVVQSPADQLFFCKILLHAADLSNPVRSFDIAKTWAERIADEFNSQVEREKSLGLQVLPFMVIPDGAALAKNEIDFCSFVVGPMWRAICGFFPELDHLQTQMNRNLVDWRAFYEVHHNKSSEP